MIISKHLKSQISFKKRSANMDKYGQFTYEDKGMIKCGIQESKRLFQTSEKEYITISTTVFTDVEINPKDLLDNREVESVTVLRDAFGRIQGYESVLK